MLWDMLYDLGRSFWGQNASGNIVLVILGDRDEARELRKLMEEHYFDVLRQERRAANWQALHEHIEWRV